MELVTVLTSLCFETVLVSTTFQKKKTKKQNFKYRVFTANISFPVSKSYSYSVYSWFADEETEAHKFKGFDL